jgi:hypothetical protein
MSDGLDIFKSACLDMGISVIDLIVHTARWVDPEIARILPVWYPAYHRGMELFQADWVTPQMNAKRGQRVKESNVRAGMALKDATGNKCDNWTCCHIWGYSDPTFQVKGSLTYNRRYYTRVSNLVLLPTPVKALTDCVPDVQQALRICAWHLYGWTPDPADAPEASMVRSGWIPDHYPTAWPNGSSMFYPPGLVRATDAIKAKACRRKAAIVRELCQAERGEIPNYPLSAVREILAADAAV